MRRTIKYKEFRALALALEHITLNSFMNSCLSMMIIMMLDDDV